MKHKQLLQDGIHRTLTIQREWQPDIEQHDGPCCKGCTKNRQQIDDHHQKQLAKEQVGPRSFHLYNEIIHYTARCKFHLTRVKSWLHQVGVVR